MTPEFKLHEGPRPNFFLVGAMKAGTTTLADALSLHPQIFSCPVKEPNFFCSDLNLNRDFSDRISQRIDQSRLKKGTKSLHYAVTKSLDGYLQLFSGVGAEEAIGEFSTNYLLSEVAASRIADFNRHAKIIIILRNPIDRAWSEYGMNQKNGTEALAFGAALEKEQKDLIEVGDGGHRRYVIGGLYHQQIGRYYRSFPEDQILLLRFEDLKEEARLVLKVVTDFLGVSTLSDEAIVSHSNKASRARFGDLNLILHRSGIKALVRGGFPSKMKELAKAFYYSERADLGPSKQDRERLLAHFSDDLLAVERDYGFDTSSWRQLNL